MKLVLTLTLAFAVSVQSARAGWLAQEGGSEKAQKKDDVGSLLERIRSKSPAERREAIDQLADAGDARAVEPLIAALRDEQPDVRATVVNALGQSATTSKTVPVAGSP